MTGATTLAALTGAYTLDPAHTRIGFVARHAMVTKVRGAFNDFEGTAGIDGSDPSKSSVRVVIKAGSVDTRSADRDGHLRGGDFLDVGQYPRIVFASTGVSRLDDSRFRLSGDLTIKDVTKPVSIDFDFEGSAQDPFGNQRIGFEGSAVISRKEFGLTWNAALETGGVLVSDKITLEFEVSAVKNG